jgi:hypothetical protein
MFSSLLCLRCPAAETVEISRVPFGIFGAGLSMEMPKRWVDTPSPIRPIPDALPKYLSESGHHSVWIKEWGWSRSFFRGSLGRMQCDAWIHRKTEKFDEDLADIADPLKKCLLVPEILFAYVKATTSQSTASNYYRRSLVRSGSAIWVRVADVAEKHRDIPTAEMWFLGVTKDTFVKIDFACIRDAKGEPGDKWLAAALYWQHRMIASLQVTGLKQYPSGKETITDWKFPEVLRPDPEFLK